MIRSGCSLRLLLLGLILACSTSREPAESQHDAKEKRELPTETGPSVAPTDRQRVLAQILTGHWVENPWFTSEDFENARRWANEPHHPAYGGHRDRLRDPETCSVERTRFDRVGHTVRVERLSIDCHEYWQQVRGVEKFFVLQGHLPESQSELDSILQLIDAAPINQVD